MGLLDSDLLVMDQVTSFMSNDFQVHDGRGEVQGWIRTEGSSLERFFTGNRHLTILDEQQRPVVLLEDVMGFGRDRFQLLLPTGEVVAELVKEFSLFRKLFTVELSSGEQLRMDGSFLDHDFQLVTADAREVARVARSWPGLAAGLMGRNRFVVQLAPGLPAHLRVVTIGAVVALDLVRAKQARAAND